MTEDYKNFKILHKYYVLIDILKYFLITLLIVLLRDNPLTLIVLIFVMSAISIISLIVLKPFLKSFHTII